MIKSRVKLIFIILLSTALTGLAADESSGDAVE